LRWDWNKKQYLFPAGRTLNRIAEMRARDFVEKIRKITKSKEFYAEFQTDHTGIPAGPAALFGQKAPQRLLPELCHHVPVERHPATA
jgi:hypothetical protein